MAALLLLLCGPAAVLAFTTTRLPTDMWGQPVTDPTGNPTGPHRAFTNPPGVSNPYPDWKPPEMWYKDQIPDPRRDVWKCGRNGRQSFVCDPNNLLTPQQADVIEQQISILRHGTGGCRCGKDCPYSTDYGGVQATVVIIPRVVFRTSSPSKSERKDVIEDYAEYLRDDKYEHGVCNDDLLIIVATQDRLVYTATGEKVSPVLNNHCVDVIYQQQKHYLSEYNWVGGINSMLNEYTAALNQQHSCNSGSTNWYAMLAVLGGIGGVGAAVFFCKRTGRCQGGGGGGMSSSHHHSSHHHHKSHSVRRHSSASASSGGGGGDF